MNIKCNVNDFKQTPHITKDLNITRNHTKLADRREKTLGILDTILLVDRKKIAFCTPALGAE